MLNWFLVALFGSSLSIAAQGTSVNLVSESELYRRGYAKEISVAEAVAEFNRRAARTELGKVQRPLKEVEVRAALLISDPEGRRRTEREERQWVELFKKDLLPRGSLLMAHTSQIFSSVNGPGSTEVSMWKVVLVLGLEKNPPTPAFWDPANKLIEIPIRFEVLEMK